MLNIPLQAIPNQAMTINLDGNTWKLSILEARGIMAVDVVRNDILIQQGIRAESGYEIIPYIYLESGNFVFITSNFEYPYYTKFGITQSLVYASAAELEVIRG